MSNILPNLLIVGAAKSGTTSLHNYLNQHENIFMCSPKEPHFLINKEWFLVDLPGYGYARVSKSNPTVYIW